MAGSSDARRVRRRRSRREPVTPRTFPLFSLLVAAVGATACLPEKTVKTEDIPTAGVRFINALPDSGGAFGLDMRFVDIVESNAHFRVPFRNNVVTSAGVPASTLVQYKNARAGQRHFVIFLSDTLPQYASIKLKDTTYTFEAGKLYSVIAWGYARPGSTPAMRVTIAQEVAPPDTTTVGLRVLNLMSTPIDVRYYPSTGTAPATPTWANVAGLSASSYVTVATGQYRFNVRDAGGTTALFADVLALPGTARDAITGIPGTPGTTQAGSAVTLLVFPRSVAGSRTPQTAAFTVPAGAFVWDRRGNGQ
jgi:hypothetical protein